MPVSLTLTDQQYGQLRRHLYPGDGLEAGAILLCGRRAGTQQHRLVVRSIYPIPYDSCLLRTPVQLTWDTESIVPLLERAWREQWTVVKIHSHPSGYPHFSTTDDDGDKPFLSALQDWVEGEFFHCSAVMLPDGRMFGRYMSADQNLLPIHKISVIGDDLVSWSAEDVAVVDEFAGSHIQAFGEGTYKHLRELSVAVVGCSGTGSPVIEQLARLGVGDLTLVDDDVVETRNLNRILNATQDDAQHKRYKVDVLADAVERMGLGTRVHRIRKSLWDADVVNAVAECDVLFGCMDTVDGRYLLNTLATFYSIPYFDIGVSLVANPVSREYGDIIEVCGSLHYLKPGYSLMSRQVFDMDAVKAAGLARTDPDAYAREVKEGYIRGIVVTRPAVISLNMTLASLGVNELLARLHPYRDERNDHYDHVQISLASMDLFKDSKPDPCSILARHVGKGDQKLLLNMPELSRKTP